MISENAKRDFNPYVFIKSQMDQQSLRCKNCLMPLSAPDIYLDEDGICNVCVAYRPKQPEGVDALLALVENYSNASQPFDCLVPMSGGLDSLYVAFYLKQNLGLKCLGLHYDTGLGSDASAKTLAWIENELDIPIIYRRIKKSQTYRIIRDSVRSLINFGPKYLQIAFCGHCGFGRRAATYREMVARNLPSIRGSHSLDKFPFRYCLNMELKMYYLQRRWYYPLGYLISKYRQANLLRSPGYSIKELLSRPFGYPNINRLSARIPDVAFFDYVPWNKANMLSDLENAGIDTGVFRNPHSDCILSPLIDHLIRAAWTVGKKEVYISNQIRAGLLTIDEGEKLIAEAQSQKLDPTILTEIGFSENEITQIFGKSVS